MPGTREIKRRITSVKNTQKITKAMEMVSSVKLRKARTAVLNARPYAEKLMEISSHLRSSVCGQLSTMLATRPVKNIGVIVITSDKGLCGGFNSSICRRTMAFAREHAGTPVSLTVIGKKGGDFFKRRDLPVKDRYADVFFKPAYAEVAPIAQKVLDAFLSNETDEVYVIFNEFRGTASQKVQVERLLPVPPFLLDGTREAPKADYVFEPEPEECLDILLKRYFLWEIWRMVLESYSSEQAARMAAMNGATKNAGELIDRLTLFYNKARQGAITKELLEVVSGAESLR
jgi:F-type H+-transporting ATPase subunit gamma